MSKKQIIEFTKSHRGSILAYSLIILAMMMAIATSLSVATIISKKGASGTESSVQSLQTADSGVQLALKKINSNLGDFINDPKNFGSDCKDVGTPAVATIENKTITTTDTGNYTLSFYKEDGTTPVLCGALASDIGMIKSVGNYNGTVRAVNVAVAAAGMSCVAKTMDVAGFAAPTLSCDTGYFATGGGNNTSANIGTTVVVDASNVPTGFKFNNNAAFTGKAFVVCCK
jgi:hypothetical protein